MLAGGHRPPYLTPFRGQTMKIPEIQHGSDKAQISGTQDRMLGATDLSTGLGARSVSFCCNRFSRFESELV